MNDTDITRKFQSLTQLGEENLITLLTTVNQVHTLDATELSKLWKAIHAKTLIDPEFKKSTRYDIITRLFEQRYRTLIQVSPSYMRDEINELTSTANYFPLSPKTKSIIQYFKDWFSR